MTSRPGAVADNLRTIRDGTRRAVEELGADLVVFPECATTGYALGERAFALAEPVDGPISGSLAALADEFAVHLAVGVIEREGDKVFNSLALFDSDGQRLTTYRKAHLFSSEREVYTAGEEIGLVDTSLGRLGLTVCYDLIFPEYVSRIVDAGAELVINSTNWITDEWQTSVGWDGTSVRSLARVRALENGVPVAMACLAGSDGPVSSLGHSTIASSTGRVVGGLEGGEGIAVARVRDSEDSRRWSELATYRTDRRLDLYR